MTIVLALLLFAVPGAAFWSLMRGLDPVGRLVVAVAAAIVVVAGTAQIMLMAGAWSPGTGLTVVVVLSALVAALARVHKRRQPPPPPPPPPPPAGVTRTDIRLPRRDEDEEDWLYEH
ncbi:hypothetical protein J4573_25685 [Actinomadura barringtoniae]|uniref:Uncharacterized protein n=1 Tax=Actinomadura barringtoniae TaxID=1427535 RepID=A0A939TBT3_9ACTN|nr:hypothetical protein [Actinomadura barringtoniae]MBO2450520.1 hypothetical protein [Actinomadura barringtoniae]